ncbi:hypothetical protein BDD12DRAFT_845207 [Trichophaea hybrida]|nr:hypothetical protein BDD12DRAFT_845207 [Trichophaea hybrida]
MIIIKQVFALAMILGVAYATAIPAPVPVEGDSLVERHAVGASELQKRQCSSNGCTCAVGTAGGIYCGSCSQVTSLGTGGNYDDVFQCNASGGCCDYGHRTSCTQSGTPCG